MTTRNCQKCWNETYHLPTGNQWSHYCPAHGRFNETGDLLCDSPERDIVCVACGHYKKDHNWGQDTYSLNRTTCNLCPEHDPCWEFVPYTSKGADDE